MNVKKIAFQVVSKQPLQKWGKIEMAFTSSVLLSLLIWPIGLDCMVYVSLAIKRHWWKFFPTFLRFKIGHSYKIHNICFILMKLGENDYLMR